MSKPIEVNELEKILKKYLPPEIVSFDTDEPKAEENLITINTAMPVENADDVVADEFSNRERKEFAAICPDINLDTGLTYCMNSKSFYVEILNDFKDAKSAEKIQAAFESADVKNYQILVHALKSTSMSIGAEDLSELAKKLELAAKENNFEEIEKNHGDLMALYQKVREEILKWLEKIPTLNVQSNT